MGLGISNTGGSFDPYLKYNAKAGRWYTKPDGGGDEFELPQVAGLFDFEYIKTGWFLFADGAPPERTFHPSMTSKAPKPTPKHKEGFQMRVMLASNLGGGVKEFASTAGGVIGAVDALYDEVCAAPEFKAGQVPVVKFLQAMPVKGAHGTNYTPKFGLVGWRPRPPELEAGDEEDAGEYTTPPTQPAQSFSGGGGSSFSGGKAYEDDLDDDVPFIHMGYIDCELGTKRRPL